MEAFKIPDKQTDKQIQIIQCERLNLSIEVYEDKEDVKETDVAYMTTPIGGLDNEYHLYFVVKNASSKYGYANWSLELFMDMIAFYCQTEFKNGFLDISTVNWKASYFYDGKYEDEGFPKPDNYMLEEIKPSDLYNLLNGY